MSKATGLADSMVDLANKAADERLRIRTNAELDELNARYRRLLHEAFPN